MARCETLQNQVKQPKGWCGEVSVRALASGWRPRVEDCAGWPEGVWAFRAGAALLGIWPE